MRFRATIRLAGKSATGIPVPAEVVSGLGSNKRPAVLVTINGFRYRSTVLSMRGEYMLPLSGERREAAGVAAGDEVEVELTLDTAPREVEVPPDLAAALDGDARAKQAFEKLAYSHKLRHVLSVEGTKNPETRLRRIEKALAKLREGR